MPEENRKGIFVIYTLYPECCEFKNWVLVDADKIRNAKVIINSKNLYQPNNSEIINGIKRYLWHGVFVEMQEEYEPTLKGGWGLRFNCDSINKNELEEILIHLGLPIPKIP